MPSIPYESQVDARTGRGGGARMQNAYDANSFGAAQGEAMSRAGQALGQVADSIDKEAERKAKEEALYVQSTFDFTDTENKVKQTVGADAAGYKDALRTAYINAVGDTTAGIQDDMARKMAKEALLADLPKYTDQANKYQQKTMEDTTKLRTNAVLATNSNKVLSDPNYYDTAVKLNNEMIDVFGAKFSQATKEEFKTNNQYDLTKKRFDGMLEQAKTPAEMDAIRQQLSSADWQDKMLPRDFEDTNNKIIAAKKAYTAKASSEANAVLKNLKDRSDDPRTLLPNEDIAQAQAAVSALPDGTPEKATAQYDLGRVIRNQSILKTNRPLTLGQQRADIEKDRNNLTTATAASPSSSVAVNTYSEKYGVPASFLQSLLPRESVSGEKNPNSSATGVGQFIDSTWLGLMKDPAIAVSLGVKPGMTDAQILELRSDPDKSIQATAILAAQNRAVMQPALGRRLSDTDLYVGHFLGSDEAVRFLRAQRDTPEAIAAASFPNAAASNRNVFYNKDGSAKTIGQVYNEIGQDFTPTTSRVAYDDIKIKEKLLAAAQEAMKGPEAIPYAVSVGAVAPAPPLDSEGGFIAKAKQWSAATAYYGQEIKPFSTDEEAWIKNQAENGTANDALNIMKSIQTAPREAADAMLKQIGEKNPSFAQAGRIALDGDSATARDVILGAKRKAENPEILTAMGYREETASVDFARIVGPSFTGLPGSDAQAVQKAAVAYLVENNRGKTYTSSDMEDAVKKVTGGRIGTYNGAKTLLPKGVSGDDMQKLFRNMNIQDYVAASVDGSTPVYAGNTNGGGAADPRDLEDEVKLRAIGGDTYELFTADNKPLWNGRVVPDPTNPAQRVPQQFYMKITPEFVKRVNEREYSAFKASVKGGVPSRILAPGV